METIIKSAMERFREKVFCNRCGISYESGSWFPHDCVCPNVRMGWACTISENEDGSFEIV